MFHLVARTFWVDHWSLNNSLFSCQVNPDKWVYTRKNWVGGRNYWHVTCYLIVLTWRVIGNECISGWFYSLMKGTFKANIDKTNWNNIDDDD